MYYEGNLMLGAIGVFVFLCQIEVMNDAYQILMPFFPNTAPRTFLTRFLAVDSHRDWPCGRPDKKLLFS